MAIYRQASLVKVIAGVSLVIGISCCFYAFEMHVMYPKTLTQDNELTSRENNQLHVNKMKDDTQNKLATLTIELNINDTLIKNDEEILDKPPLLPLDSEQQAALNPDDLFRQLVVVTAMTNTQVADGLQLIASVQKYMPDTRIIVYNIGIKPKNLENIKRLCNVHVRHFSFETHPRHVRNLKIFAWRPIIIQESVDEFGVVFYADPNVRFSASLRELIPLTHRHHGILVHIHGFDAKVPSTTRHVYYETIPKMFDYFQVKRREYYLANDSTPHIATGRMLIVNNSVIQEKLLQPLTRCALNDRCISPRGATGTGHKFDTSALAIIVYKNLPQEWTPDNDNTKLFDQVVDLRYQKRITSSDTPTYCNDDGRA